MAYLAVSLLGTFQVTLNDEPITKFKTDKVRALLACLAVEADRPHRRESLAGLLWPDYDHRAALRNLTQTLTRLRRAIGDHDATPSFLLITHKTIQFNPNSDYWLDATAFTSLISATDQHHHRRPAVCRPCMKRLQQAAALYRGDFLKGIFLEDSDLFDEWLLIHRERFHQQALEVFAHLATYHQHHGEHAQVLDYARRQLKLEPWREEAHRQMMRGLALTGQRNAALAQYQRLRCILDEELGIEPEDETTALYEQIQQENLTETASRHNLPVQLTVFIGRETELEQIAECLARTDCRLLTLVGLGGVGKTRLALQAATNHLADFADGVYFVPLAAVNEASLMVPAIANAIKLTFSGQADPKQQLLDYLRSKEMLLVLDSFEHLLDGTDLLTEILTHAPEVNLLVTSRQRLNLSGEWVIDLHGLYVPPIGVNGSPQDYDAVQLFVQSAHRVRQDFTLSNENTPSVFRICRLVDGLPLAIELAASWARVLSCEEIASEIEGRLSFLETTLHDVPERHRSLQATFDYSWQLLSEVEKRALRQLSVFRGGFGRHAVEVVAGVSTPQLISLVNQSLLHRSSSTRYDMHELLRQYAGEKLARQPDSDEETKNRHSAYYLDFVTDRTAALRGQTRAEGQDETQQQALDKIRTEMENIRLAWEWAVEQTAVDKLESALEGLYLFYTIRSYFQEGHDTFERTAERLRQLDPESSIAWKALARQGVFCFRLGRFKKAKALLQQSLAAFGKLNNLSETTFCLQFLGRVSYMLGQTVEARHLFEQALTLARAAQLCQLEADSLRHLGWILLVETDYASAQTHIEQALRLYHKFATGHFLRNQVFSLAQAPLTA